MATIDWTSLIKAVGPSIAAIITGILAAGGLASICLKYWLKNRDKEKARREEAVRCVCLAESFMQDAMIKCLSQLYPQIDEYVDQALDTEAHSIAGAGLQCLRRVIQDYSDILPKDAKKLLVECIQSAESLLTSYRGPPESYCHGDGEKVEKLYNDVLRLRDMMISIKQ